MTTRIGLIGLGGIAQKAYLPILTSLDTVEIVAVMSRRPETVNRICRQYRLSKGVTELADFLRAGAEAAIVLTPSPTHFQVVQSLLDAELDVLVEKPATLVSGETAALGDLAEKHRRILMVGFNRRYSPLYRQAKDLFASRRVALCLAEKHRASAAHASLLANYVDDTIHLIDLARWFGGDGHAVTTCRRLRDGKLVDAVSMVAFDAGGIGIIATSLEAGGWQERVTLHGEQLTVEVEAFRELRVVRGDREEIMGRQVAGQWTTSLETRGFAPLIRHFLECVGNRQTPETNALEAYKTQVLLEEMAAKVSEA